MTVNQCKNLASNHRNGFNSAYLDILMNEMPKQDLEGMNIGHSKNIVMDMKQGQVVNEDFIA